MKQSTSKKLIIAIFVAILCLLASSGFSQPPTIPGTFNYKKVDISDWLGVPNDSMPGSSMATWQKNLPSIAVVEDSNFLIWSVSQQRYITPRVTSAASVSWADIIGTNPMVNTYLASLFNAKQNLLPSGTSAQYVGGDWYLHNLDSFLTAHGWVNKTDSIFTSVQNGSVDSLNFSNGVYRTGNNVYAHYEWAIWNANRLQSFFIEANTHPGNGYFLGMDSLAGVIRWMRPDSVVGSGSTSTLQQVTDAGSTTTDNINTGFVGWGFSGTTLGHLTMHVVGGTNYGGSLTLKSPKTSNSAVLQAPDSLGAADQWFYLNKGNSGTIDTLATLYDLRGISGGGGGSTPTFDQVLAAGTTLATNYSITGGKITFNGQGMASYQGNTSTQYSGVYNFGNNEARVEASSVTNGDYAVVRVINSTTSGGGGHILIGQNDGTFTYSYTLSIDNNGFDFLNGGSGHLLIKLEDVPTYTDNASALAGGLSAGHLYRNGDILQIVH